MRVLTGLFGLDLIRVQAPITLAAPDNTYTEPEPDLAVSRQPEDIYAGRHSGPEDILLLAEVSDTTIRTDLIVKARLYARAGIPEYWTTDLGARRGHVHSQPANGEYTVVTVHEDSDTATAAAHPNSPIAVSALLPSVAGQDA